MKNGSLNKIAFKKMLSSKSSLFSLLIICVCFISSCFSYLFIPDKTPYANQMYLELATLPPKSKIVFLQIPNNNYAKDSFFQYFFVGKKSSFTKIPIVDFLEDANSLRYTTLHILPLNQKYMSVHTKLKNKLFGLVPIDLVEIYSVGLYMELGFQWQLD